MLIFTLFILPAHSADDGSCYAWLPAEVVASIENEDLEEISGLVASRTHANILWGHNDAGNDARLYAIGLDGSDMGSVFVPGAFNEDWEDIAIGPCGTDSEDCACIYIGDMGNNEYQRDGGVVYRLPEPEPVAGGQSTVPDALPFRYPDGLYDAEALLVHPITGETLIITKNVPDNDSTEVNESENEPSRVYAFPQSPPAGGDEVELTFIATLDLIALGADSPFITGADFSPRGNRVVVRTNEDVLLFDVTTTLAAAFSSGQTPMPGSSEQDPEAVAFSIDGASLYLAGESVAPELWEIRCVGMDSDTADSADPLTDCADETKTCGCRGGGAAGLLFLPLLLWRRRLTAPT